MRKIWPFSFNLVMFMGVAFVLPFIVLYYQSLGFNGAQIGLLTGLTPLVTLFAAPLWTGLADATRRHRLIMSLTLLMGASAIFLFPFFKAFVPILLLAVLYNVFFAPVGAFADSATMAMLGDERAMYGRIRLGGTFGFGLAAMLAGEIFHRYGLPALFWGSGTLFFLAMVVSQKLVHSQAQGSRVTGREVRALLTNRGWIGFLTMAFAGGLSLAATNNYFFSYLHELGASERLMGFSLTLATISEVPVLFFGNRLQQRLKARGLLLLALLITGARLLAFAAVGTPTQALLLQLLGGLTFPAMWVAGVAYADEHSPPGLAATGQGLFSAVVFGFGMAVGGFGGGLLLEGLGGRGLYLVFGAAVLATVGLGTLIGAGGRRAAEKQAAPSV